MILLVLLLTGFGSFAAAQPIISQTNIVEVTLELAPDEGLLVNRLNPPEVSIESPWEASPLPATISGEPWAEHPEVYFSHIDPVHWTLIVPEGTPPGRYEATVMAKLGLCKSDFGFCFVRREVKLVVLDVAEPGTESGTEVNAAQAEGSELPNVNMTLKFHAPSF